MHKVVFVAGALLASTQFAAAQTPAATSAAGGHYMTTLDNTDMLSSNVVGLDVYNSNKEDIGQIKDIAMGPSGPQAYIVSVGGFLGMGTKYVAVSPSEVKISYDAGDKKWHGMMNASKDDLKAAPEFKYEGKWNASQK